MRSLLQGGVKKSFALSSLLRRLLFFLLWTLPVSIFFRVFIFLWTLVTGKKKTDQNEDDRRPAMQVSGRVRSAIYRINEALASERHNAAFENIPSSGSTSSQVDTNQNQNGFFKRLLTKVVTKQPPINCEDPNKPWTLQQSFFLDVFLLLSTAIMLLYFHHNVLSVMQVENYYLT